ncbi:lysozyme inhibitor LprI family protein [Oceanomicrobium pacificus]|uniref:DUF1311 domain-containing protein n=1 Tax=Oceanomicrobium pacificus TaxID=2692916 RepID=A0A6B0TYX7_9RHOB|nr:lysozyme inhibitor LprI family protein [Oceanomicrobium pacificus]MXU64111.1 DUF1311 domain-containing protein [Oceanomicrobium pacificus]
MRRAAASLLVALAALPVAAQEADVDCNNQLTTFDMRVCADRAYKAADEDLNVDYRRAMEWMTSLDADLPDDQRGGAEALRDAQRAWIDFRDKACLAQGFTYRGGTLEPVIILYCLEDLTRQRSEQLRIIWEEN